MEGAYIECARRPSRNQITIAPLNDRNVFVIDDAVEHADPLLQRQSMVEKVTAEFSIQLLAFSSVEPVKVHLKGDIPKEII